ncbi:MAG: radical SAM protein [Firmicutes bacterium]|nr:radical SAM protein [Bacillota bacterium]
MFKYAKKFVGEAVITEVTNYLAKNPEKNIETLINLVSKMAIRENHKKQIASVSKYLSDKDSHWHKLFVTTLKETHPKVRERFAVNFIINSVLSGIPKQYELAEKLGYAVPWAILMDPTDRCNLRCKGCWAGEYLMKNDLPLELMDRIVSEGEELNIFFYLFSGGEPLIRKNDILKLAQKHPDSIFHIFTNGTLIDEKFAEECLDAANITFAISIDGFEKATDMRRGKGIFAKVMKAADILRKQGLIFGFSTTYHRYNVDEITSDEYIDMLIDKGFRFGWLFTYVPVGSEADVEFMATPQQRAHAWKRIQEIRATKPILVADFWNDGEFSGGCVAGGRRYFHINAAGDVEPCAFVHYSCANIRSMSLKEALGNPLFRAYQKRQPFNENHLRPCPLIDNPHELVACVRESQAQCTQTVPTDPERLASSLANYAAEWGKIADKMSKRI